MKFAHMADLHIGGWSEKELERIGIEAFEESVDICIAKRVGFVIIAGDLFDTSIPNIDLIKEVARILNKLKEEEISCYIIPGSHDYSPSGKTMLDVLEKAGLVENVMKYDNKEDKIELKFTEDKTGVKLTGIYGKKAGLEIEFYKCLIRDNLEQEKGFKIFLFHTTLDELKTKDYDNVEGHDLAIFPKGFNYYAGGHIHVVNSINKEGYGKIVYPGPIFPNNFSELEKLKQGGFYIVDDNLNMEKIEIKIKEVVSFNINVDNLNPQQAYDKILSEISLKDINNKIVTLRVHGNLNGKVSDINLKKIIESLNCYHVLKNISGLKSKESEKIQIESGDVLDIENKIISENLKNVDFKDKFKDLMQVLSLEKQEGETNSGFEDRLIKEVESLFE